MKTEDILAFAAIAGARAQCYEGELFSGYEKKEFYKKHFPAYPDGWPPLSTPCPPWPEPLQVTPTTARWHAAEETRNEGYRNGYWRWLLKACVPAPNEELIERYGPDATIAIAQIGAWAFSGRGTYAQTYFRQPDGRIGGWLNFRTLDIHTLPPIGPGCCRLELHQMPNLRRFIDKSFSQLIGLGVWDCPALEEFPDLPQLEEGYKGAFKMELKKGVTDLVEDLTVEIHPYNRFLQEQVAAEHLRIWRRRVFWRNNLEHLVAEAWKPSRIAERLERLGFEGLLYEENAREETAHGPPEIIWTSCKKPQRSWIDMYTAGTRPGICSYATRVARAVTVDHHGPIYHTKCRFCGEPWFTRNSVGYEPLSR
jgi:hypothetical protein